MTPKRLFLFVFLPLLLCGVSSTTAAAQDVESAGLRAKPAPAPQITVSGTIQQVISQHAPGTPFGLHLLVTSPMGVVDTSVGPNLTDEVKQALTTGQPVQVVGVIRTVNGRNYLFAHQLLLAGRQIPIRNDNGFLIHTHSTTGNRPQPSESEFNGGVK